MEDYIRMLTIQFDEGTVVVMLLAITNENDVAKLSNGTVIGRGRYVPMGLYRH